MYITENCEKNNRDFLLAPLFERHQIRRAIVKSTTALFPFMLFAALFAFIVVQLGKFVPSLESGLYWISYMSIQLFGIGFAAMLAYNINGFFPALISGVVSAYFGLLCTQVAGVGIIEGSSVIGFMGYFLIALMSSTAYEFLHRVCVVVIEWFYGIIFKLMHSKIKDEVTCEKTIESLRPQLKNMVLLGDSLIVIGLAGYAVFFVINYLYALPMTELALALARVISTSKNAILCGAIIGFSFGFDAGGPVTLAVFNEIFNGVISGSEWSTRLMTIFSAAMITPSWICMAYCLTCKKFKGWPTTCYDENLLNTGFINEVFQNTRLMAMSPMAYAIREPDTMPFAYIVGTTITGIIASLTGIKNTSLLTEYASKYGLLRTGTVVYTEKYDAFAGLMPPLYANGGIKVILLSFLSAAVGAGIGYAFMVLLKKEKYSRQTKAGKDLFLEFGFEYTKEEWDNTYKKKSGLEKKLFSEETDKEYEQPEEIAAK